MLLGFWSRWEWTRELDCGSKSIVVCAHSWIVKIGSKLVSFLEIESNLRNYGGDFIKASDFVVVV